MDTLLQDLRLAIRIAVAILSLGIGATTAIFTVVNRVVLNPLPYPDPERIVYLGWSWKSGGYASNLSPRKFLYVRENGRVFDGLATQRWFDAELGVTDPGAPIEGLRVSDDFFRVLGTAPAIGRAFLPDAPRCARGAAQPPALDLTLRRRLQRGRARDPDGWNAVHGHRRDASLVPSRRRSRLGGRARTTLLQ
jgi:hypothetical protein